MPSKRWAWNDFCNFPKLCQQIQAEHPELSSEDVHQRAVDLRREHYRLQKSWQRSQIKWKQNVHLNGLRHQLDLPPRDWQI